MIRWGVIGCGEATEKKSGPAFQQIRGSKIEAVMSRNADRARSYAERPGIIIWYTNHKLRFCVICKINNN